MLINEVDAIPQRNCLNLSDLKKKKGEHAGKYRHEALHT